MIRMDQIIQSLLLICSFIFLFYLAQAVVFFAKL